MTIPMTMTTPHPIRPAVRRFKAPFLASLLGCATVATLLSPALHAEESAPPAHFTAGGEPETQAQHDARMAWWREAKFGLFIHWGLYAIPAGSWNEREIGGGGEWILFRAKIPLADYKALAPKFNPVKFDAKSWVALAKEAGMKYLVITAKHHDGFAMFHSKVDGFNLYDATPFKRDPLAELAEECRKQGIRFGLYYSQAQDWSHPGGARWKEIAPWDDGQKGDMDEYLEKVAVPQVKEILNHYGPISVLWWDTPSSMTKERAEAFLPLLKEHPQLITNNRLGGGFKGDTETPEQRIPAQGYPGRDWETCMTMNGTWGYKSYDHDWKSTETLLRNLVDIASKGGNYLLNVGPDAEGVIPEPSVERLRAIGKWMQVNGESIYGSGPTLFGAEAETLSKTKKDSKGNPVSEPAWEWRCTTKPGKIYLHLFQWPGEKFAIPAVKETVTRAYLLDGKTPVQFAQKPDSVTLTGLPATAPNSPNALDTVICLETTAPSNPSKQPAQ